MSPEEVALRADIVKIALPIIGTVVGAIIGGVSAYFVAKANVKNQVAISDRKLKDDIILSVIRSVARFKGHAFSYFIALDISTGKKKYPAFELENIKGAVITSSENIHEALASLRVLRLDEEADALKEFLKPFQKVWRLEHNHEEDLNETRGEMNKLEREFYMLISSYFSSNNQRQPPH